MLVAVDGVELTYDEIGNVLAFGDRSFTWNSGRNLASVTDGSNTYSYKYDENGIRTSKNVNGVTTYYNARDGVILSQSDGTNTMYFQYDNSGTPVGFILNGTQYFYMTNQMGDVFAITDSNGNVICEYVYDEWGDIRAINIVDENNAEYVSVANANPLRYRGYYYDTETGYYYLQSRYYDPSICRFINADIPETAQMAKDYSVGANLFAYCENNPVMNIDYTGYLNINRLKKESWVVRAVAKYIANFSYTKWSKIVFSTPKWLGAYLELNVAYGYQSNAQGIISFGFSRYSFDVGISFGTGKTSTALSIGATWSEIYVQSSIVFSSKTERIFFAVNFKFAVKHWFTLGVAALCYAVPALIPVAKTAIQLIWSSRKTAKPLVLFMLPRLLGV